jgi:hypothetical protein
MRYASTVVALGKHRACCIPQIGSRCHYQYVELRCPLCCICGNTSSIIAAAAAAVLAARCNVIALTICRSVLACM